MEDAAILVEDLHFTYEGADTPVLRGLSAEMRRGEFSVLAGPSGAGKSTLCRTFNNIIPLFFRGNFSGRRRITGDVLEAQSIAAMARKVGMVFQDFEQQLFSTSTLLELSFGLENFNVPAAEMQERINELLNRFGIAHLTGREPYSLSGGEKQKLAIASVMAYRPQILVLDEPTTDLDPDSREFVLRVIPRLKDWIETIIVVDHETELFREADRIFLMREGCITASGSGPEILTRSGLLLENDLAPLDLVLLQESLQFPLNLQPAPILAEQLNGYRLEPLEIPARSSSKAVVEVDRLIYRYESQMSPALDDVSLEIREGEFVGIVGHNGSGKSTLLRHLNGLQLPQQGALRILGRDVRQWKRRELSRTVGLVFQNPDHQIFHGSVREEVEFGPRQFGFPEEEVQGNVRLAMETMDLQAKADRDPFQLSKGERQRVAVASILSTNPDILILDEPTTGLDYRQQKYMMELLSDLHRNGKTIIIVTHAVKLVGEYCDYAVLLEKGKKVAEGHPRELFFGDACRMKVPELWALSRLAKGNALTVEEFKRQLKRV